MFYKIATVLFVMGFSGGVMASTSVPITGSVQSKCVITQDVAGVYGNPAPGVLSTDPASGGVRPVVRYDVVQAGFYSARITTPDFFTESPVLNDILNWSGLVFVDQVTDAEMSSYDVNKVEYNNVTEFSLTVAGSTWFAVQSDVLYGTGRALPGGQYQTAVTAECIAI